MAQNKKSGVYVTLIHENPLVGKIISNLCNASNFLRMGDCYSSYEEYRTRAKSQPPTQEIIMIGEDFHTEKSFPASNYRTGLTIAGKLREKDKSTNIIVLMNDSKNGAALRNYAYAERSDTIIESLYSADESRDLYAEFFSRSAKAAVYLEAKKQGLIQGTMLLPPKLTENMPMMSLRNEFKLIQKDLNERRRLRQTLDIGILGAGQFGDQLMQRFMTKEWIDRIDVFSEHFSLNSDFRQAHLRLRDNANGGGKLKFPDTLSEFLQHKYDFLFLCAGPKDFDYSAFSKRDMKEAEILFEASREKNKRLIWAIADGQPETTLIVASNIVEAIVQYAKNLGIRGVASFCSDYRRLQRIIHDELLTRNSTLEYYIKREDISVDATVGHGDLAWPRLAEAVIMSRGLDAFPNIFKRIPKSGTYRFRPEFVSESKNRIRDKLRQEGKEIMMACKLIGKNYTDAPETFVEAIEDIAYFKSRPRSSAHCVLDKGETEYFIPGNQKKIRSPAVVLPVTFKYAEKGVEIVRDTSRSITAISPEEKKEIAKAIIRNNDLVKRFNKS